MSDEQKIVESIPLKSDTDFPTLEASAAALVAGTDAETAPEEPKPKKNWFTWGKKKNATEATVNIEEGGEIGEATTGTAKKCQWWKRTTNKAKGEEDQKNENISIGIDLVNRDSQSINNHIQFGFEDIFGEADSQHSWDCVWRLNYRVFIWTRLFVYRLLSLLALPFTIIFAIFFGLVSCLNVFIIVPFAKLLSIPGNGLGLVWNWLIHTIFDPIASSIGLLFSKFKIQKYGINQENTAPCV